MKPTFWTHTNISARLSESPGSHRAQKENQKKTCLDSQPVDDRFEVWTKSQGLSNAQFRIDIVVNCAFNRPCYFIHGVHNAFPEVICSNCIYKHLCIIIYIHVFEWNMCFSFSLSLSLSSWTRTDISARLSEFTGTVLSFAGVSSSRKATWKTNMVGFAACGWCFKIVYFWKIESGPHVKKLVRLCGPQQYAKYTKIQNI